MSRIQIKFIDLLTGENQEREYNNTSKDHAIDKLRREFASFGIQILEIIDKEEQEIYNKIDEIKQKQIEDTIKIIKSTIKTFIKKPYDSKNQKRSKTIKCKYIDSVKDYLNNNYNKYFDGFIYDDKIEINTLLNEIYIVPTQEYFLKAD